MTATVRFVDGPRAGAHLQAEMRVKLGTRVRLSGRAGRADEYRITEEIGRAEYAANYVGRVPMRYAKRAV